MARVRNRNPNPHQVLEYVRQFDRSGDGLLSLPEFSKLVRLQPYAQCPMPNAHYPLPTAQN